MKLLILDLDETLIHTERFEKDYLDEGSYDFKFSVTNPMYEYFTLKRPYLNEFLDYAFSNFKVAVWTAASKDYAKTIIDNIGIDSNKLEFLYTEENCTIKVKYDGCYGIYSVVGDGTYYGEKNLNKIRSKYNLKDVLIVDDIPETASNNYGNLIRINPFTSSPNDTELLKLISYLETIKDSDNFRSIEKRGWSKHK